MAYAIITGGGKIGYYLARSLINNDYEVLILEKNPSTYRYLSSDLGDVVMHGDGCDPLVLKSAGIQRADLVVAATGDDAGNLVTCQLAAHCFGRPRIIARVNDPANGDLFDSLGITERVSGTSAILNLVSQKVGRSNVILLGDLARGNIEVMEIIVQENSPFAEARLADIKLPPNTLVISVLRNDNAMLPTADTVFEVGDVVVLLIPRELEAMLREFIV